MTNRSSILKNDRQYVWHPYSAIDSDQPIYPVESADGVHIKLLDGGILIDGMSSWWSAIHGYNHPQINQAITEQLQKMAHIMFGGLTHQPAVDLATYLVDITPKSLQTVFFVDSGSVSVEVAMKMAIQYWYAKKLPIKNKFLTIRQGYHGDTFAAMSVSDPVNGMHSLFANTLCPQFFADSPTCRFDQACSESDIAPLALQLKNHHRQIAAIILEPIVQGAGGMNFYSPEYLKRVKILCKQYDVLLILDEIATGFGRTGKLFACEHAGIEPDILCLGKALTGGYMTLAATLSTKHIAETISNGEPGLFMHGPTFMANPLACSVALASLKILLNSPWQQQIKQIETHLKTGLAPCKQFPQVKDVRVLGAIGVVELHHEINLQTLQAQFVDAGVWIRPFNRLIYLMPPYIIEQRELKILTMAITQIVSTLDQET
ncbi:MAG: adenosylmethionine--8-amino-7-oxononanoate transaminase [Methylococcales symbiont of Iophon sp. n. MRB-2018]|nr:MAG: adenosylmethionine--8-amino-7-oxononanoate transaminase [Methylococcales symbiont of Iophon sp. n. MRB-2018]KAF3979409.1 MAG: adenosylmethionine--8-amino-7-oxononanoate transaminase [Methylococcales symbiont of Iophon sp. n. MRB-2018]